ncbi:hypothetical protein KSS87_005452 [Heliosperma pusillum]|nr:hypothetical protein KSS87_005452 [Heliosperma pusillum]
MEVATMEAWYIAVDREANEVYMDYAITLTFIIIYFIIIILVVVVVVAAVVAVVVAVVVVVVVVVVVAAVVEKKIGHQHEIIDYVYDQCINQPCIYYMRRHYSSCSIPSYFKRDSSYDDDDDDERFMEELGKLEIPMRSRPNYIKRATESLVKDVVVELIWTDLSALNYMFKPEQWNFDNWGIELPLSKQEMDYIYTSIIQSAASLIYLLYPQAQLYKIGHARTLDKQLDKLWDQLQQYCKEDRLYHEVCIFVIQLISNNDEYNLVTEEDIGDILYVVAQEDKDELFKDIAAVVKDIKPPTLKADELTHWILTLLKGDEPDVESNIIRKTINDILKLPVHSGFHDNFHPLLDELLYTAKHRAKCRLGEVKMPLIEICEPKDHEMSRVIFEIVEVAELRRMALGARFIGRSHLIWAFYKVGYGEECAKLLHFIFAVIYSKDIGIDGRGVIQLYGCFQEFKQDLEEVGDEIEHNYISTMRPCRAVDAIIQAMRDEFR